MYDEEADYAAELSSIEWQRVRRLNLVESNIPEFDRTHLRSNESLLRRFEIGRDLIWPSSRPKVAGSEILTRNLSEIELNQPLAALYERCRGSSEWRSYGGHDRI